MVRFVTLFSLVCGSICTLHSCKKENKAVYLTEQFKQKFDYKPGTYWIYYDSLSNMRDSFVVTETSTHGPFQPFGSQPENLEYTIKTIHAFDSVGNSIDYFQYILIAPDQLTFTYNSFNYGTVKFKILSGDPVKTGEIEYNSYLENVATYQDQSRLYHDLYHYYTYSPSSINIYVSSQFGFVSILSGGNLIGPRSLHLMREYLIK